MNGEMVDIAHIYIYIYIIKVQVVTRPQVSAISGTQNKPVMFDILQTVMQNIIDHNMLNTY